MLVDGGRGSRDRILAGYKRGYCESIDNAGRSMGLQCTVILSCEVADLNVARVRTCPSRSTSRTKWHRESKSLLEYH